MKAVLLALTLPIVASTQQAPSAANPGMVAPLSWLAARLNDPNVVVITTGERTDYIAGHIPGARYIGHEETLDHTDHGLLDPQPLAVALARVGARDDAHIVLYGASAMETGWLYMAFASLGHGGHVSILDGNLEAWRRANLPVDKAVVPDARGRLTPRAASDVIVDAKYVRDRLQSSAAKILDVRTEQERARGFVPGSTLVLWQDLFSDQKLLTFKSRDDIRALLTRAGVTADKEAVTYCAVGMRASLMYFAARHAGIPARVYLGSWRDWSSQAGNPIAKGHD